MLPQAANAAKKRAWRYGCRIAVSSLIASLSRKQEGKGMVSSPGAFVPSPAFLRVSPPALSRRAAGS
jgi:hypothetical protein